MLIDTATNQIAANSVVDAGKPKIIVLEVIAGTPRIKKAYLTIAFGKGVEMIQKTAQVKTEGGPLHAIAQAIRELVPHDAKLSHYSVKALGEGTDAEGKTIVILKIGDRKFRATSKNRDTDLGFARAYLGAVNQWKASKRKVRRSR